MARRSRVSASRAATLANVKTFLRKSGLEYDELLALLDLPFINPARDIVIQHLDASCDTDKKSSRTEPGEARSDSPLFAPVAQAPWLEAMGARSRDRCPGIGGGALDEPFLINLFSFGRLKSRLGPKTTSRNCAPSSTT